MKAKSRRSSFIAGFWQGLAAPVMLFDAPQVDIQALKPPGAQDVPPHIQDMLSMRADWEKIGGDFRVAIEKINQELGSQSDLT